MCFEIKGNYKSNYLGFSQSIPTEKKKIIIKSCPSLFLVEHPFTLRSYLQFTSHMEIMEMACKYLSSEYHNHTLHMTCGI